MEDDGGGSEEKKRGEDEEEQVEMKSPSSSEAEAMAMDPCGGQWPMLRFEVAPQRIYHFSQQFRNPNPNNNNDNGNNFLKGVKWSPDGSCFLTSSDDNTLRLFSLWVTITIKSS